jgi:predicted PurR-regulated permease PerM
MSFPGPTERQARLLWLAVSGLAIAVLVTLAVAAIWGLGKILQLLSPVLWPIAVAGVISYLLDPLVDRLERRGFTRRRAIAMVFGLALVAVLALGGSIVPQLVRETRQLMAGIPAYAQNLQQRAENWINNPPPLLRRFLALHAPSPAPQPPTSATNPPAPGITNTQGPPPLTTNAPVAASSGPFFTDEHIKTATSWLARTLPKIGSWLFGQMGKVASWFGFIAGLALVPVYIFYFLLEKHGISSRWTDYLPVSDSRFKTELVFVINSINNYLIAFFRGQVLVAICDGLLYGFGFLAIGLPYALLIGVMAVFLTMIPYLGAIVTCITALIIAIVHFGDWLHPVLVLAVFGLVQTLEGLVISPRIMGGRVGLHPVTIIIAVMVGTTLLGGLLGGILAIPLTAALRVLMFRYVWKTRAAAAPQSHLP